MSKRVAGIRSFQIVLKRLFIIDFYTFPIQECIAQKSGRLSIPFFRSKLKIKNSQGVILFFAIPEPILLSQIEKYSPLFKCIDFPNGIHNGRIYDKESSSQNNDYKYKAKYCFCPAICFHCSLWFDIVVTYGEML